MPNIYVASLTDYNSGRYHGTWINIDETTDVDDVHTEIDAMLSSSPSRLAEEYAIHDYEQFEGYRVGEYASVDEVVAVGRAIAEHGEAVALYAEYVGDVEQALKDFEEAYRGKFDSARDYVEQFADDTGMLDEVPESLRGYIDFERMARDAVLGGDIYVADGYGGIVHVFYANV